MMTPLELENKKFKKSLSGYNKTEIDEFFRIVCDNYETIYKENLANRDKINMLSNAIKQYKSMEETLQSAILVAQSAGDEVVHNAKKKAENIIADAETKATQLLSDASREVTRINFEYEEMKRNVEVFRTRVISLLTSQLDIVKEFSMPDKRIESEEIKVTSEPLKIDADDDDNKMDMLSTLKDLERVTKELPKIKINEKGEYVAAESENDADFANE
jgi:cell division initiation protein